MSTEEFMQKIKSLLDGEMSEDEIIATLTDIEAQYNKLNALKSKRVADFFNRSDTEEMTSEEETLQTETETTPADTEVVEEQIGVEDILEEEQTGESENIEDIKEEEKTYEE